MLVLTQCGQCLQVLTNESVKENKLRCHLCSAHPNFVENPLSYWKDKEEQVRRRRSDAPSGSAFCLEKVSLASFEVAWRIARCKKPVVKTAGGADVAKTVDLVPLSNISIKLRIDLLSLGSLDQRTVALKSDRKVFIADR
ncbi:protein FAM200B-like [Panulirus ornatus]|uniref:protein FAM200B-like n=1 Tax=Panulirus ornatus TaxID=150431 RepID=UPI003A89F027